MSGPPQQEEPSGRSGPFAAGPRQQEEQAGRPDPVAAGPPQQHELPGRNDPFATGPAQHQLHQAQAGQLGSSTAEEKTNAPFCQTDEPVDPFAQSSRSYGEISGAAIGNTIAPQEVSLSTIGSPPEGQVGHERDISGDEGALPEMNRQSTMEILQRDENDRVKKSVEEAPRAIGISDGDNRVQHVSRRDTIEVLREDYAGTQPKQSNDAVVPDSTEERTIQSKTPKISRRTTMEILRDTDSFANPEPAATSAAEELQKAELEALRAELDQVEHRAVQAEKELENYRVETEAKLSEQARDMETKLKAQNDDADSRIRAVEKYMQEEKGAFEAKIEEVRTQVRQQVGEERDKLEKSQETSFSELMEQKLKGQQERYEARFVEASQEAERQRVAMEADKNKQKVELENQAKEMLAKQKASAALKLDEALKAQEDTIRKSIQTELTAGFEEQRDELVKMMKSQAEEYRAKLKARHATEIKDLEVEIRGLRDELSAARKQAANEDQTGRLRSKVNALKAEVAQLKSEITDRDNNEATYREEFERELEREFRSMMAAQQDSASEGGHSPAKSSPARTSAISQNLDRSWKKDLAESFAEDMREVDAILADTMFTDEELLNESMASNGLNGFKTPNTIAFDEGITLPGGLEDSLGTVDMTSRELRAKYSPSASSFSAKPEGEVKRVDAADPSPEKPSSAAAQSAGPEMAGGLRAEDLSSPDGAASERLDDPISGAATQDSQPEETPWIQQFDPSSGNLYYVNRSDGSSVWDPPAHDFVPLPADYLAEIKSMRASAGPEMDGSVQPSTEETQEVERTEATEVTGEGEKADPEPNFNLPNMEPSSQSSPNMTAADGPPPFAADGAGAPALASDASAPPEGSSPGGLSTGSPVLGAANSPVAAPSKSTNEPSTKPISATPVAPNSSLPTNTNRAAEANADQPAQSEEAFKPEIDSTIKEPRDILLSLEAVIAKIEKIGVKSGTESRQLREVKKGMDTLRKQYVGDDSHKNITKKSKDLLSQLGFALDKHDFKAALGCQVKLAGGKDWRKHKKWIKPLKFCIELAKKKFPGSGEKKKPIILGQGRPDLMVRQAPEKTKDKQAEKETPTETAPKVAGPPTARGGPVPPMGPLSSKSGPPPPTQASAVAPPAASNMLFSEDADGLCRACLQGDVGTVKKILGKVNPNSADAEGKTALHASAAVGSLECAKILLAYKASPSARNTSNETPLDVAMSKMMSMNNPSPDFLEMVDLLEKAAAGSTPARPMQQVDLSSPPPMQQGDDKKGAGWFW